MSRVNLSDVIAPAFYPVHLDIKRGGHTEYWLKGGRASTKSSVVSIEIIQGLMRDPGTHAVVYRKVADTLHDSVYEQLIWAIYALGVQAFWRAKKSPLELIYTPTDQRILFKGADDPQKSKSVKFHNGYAKYLWFEELTEFDDMESVRMIIQSIIRGGDKAVIFYTYNPPRSMQNWVNEECLIPNATRLTHHSTYLDVPQEWLGSAFILFAEHSREVNERAYRHEYLGEITGTGGQVFDNLNIRQITDDEIKTFDKLYHGLDFGFASDPDAALRMHYDKRTMRLYIFGEHYASGANYNTLCEALERVNPENMLTYADSADPRSISELNTRGRRITAASKPAGSVEAGMRWLEGLAEIVIDPARCPNAAREFGGYERKQDRHGNFLAAYPDQNNHTIDAARYGLEPLISLRTVKVINRARLGL